MNNDAIWICTITLIIVSLLCVIIQLHNDLTRVNKKIDRIAKHIGVPEIITENVDGELKELILKGERIKAIKRYRHLTGESLKEAKDYVDLLSEKDL